MKSHHRKIEELLQRLGSTESLDSLCGQGLLALQEAGLILEDGSTDALIKTFVASSHKETILDWFDVLKCFSLLNVKCKEITRLLIENPEKAKILFASVNILMTSEMFAAFTTEEERAVAVLKIIASSPRADYVQICLSYMQSLQLLADQALHREIFDKVIMSTDIPKRLSLCFFPLVVAGYFAKPGDRAEVIKTLLDDTNQLWEVFHAAVLLLKVGALEKSLESAIVKNMALLCQEGDQRSAYIAQLTQQYEHKPALIKAIMDECYLDVKVNRNKMVAMTAFVGNKFLTVDQFPEWYERLARANPGKQFVTLEIVLLQIGMLPSQCERDLMQYISRKPKELGRVGDFLAYLSRARLVSNNSFVAKIIKDFIKYAVHSQSINQCLYLFSVTNFLYAESAAIIVDAVVKNAPNSKDLHAILDVLHTVNCVSTQLPAMSLDNIDRLTSNAGPDLLYLINQLVVQDGALAYPHRCLRLSFLIGYSQYAQSMAAAHKLLESAGIRDDDVMCMTGKYAARYAGAIVCLQSAGLFHHELLKSQLLINAKYAEDIARFITFLQMHAMPYEHLGSLEEAIFSARRSVIYMHNVLFNMQEMHFAVTRHHLTVLLSDPSHTECLYAVLKKLKSTDLLLGDQREANISALFQYYDFMSSFVLLMTALKEVPITQSIFDDMIVKIKAEKTTLQQQAAVLAQGMCANPAFGAVMSQNLTKVVGFFAPVHCQRIQKEMIEERYTKTRLRSFQ